MSSVLQQLDDTDAVLLMYVADELPAGDRAEVERMLSVDDDLRGRFERLRESYEWVDAELARGDGATRLAMPEAVAVRRVGRAMRQWHARRLAAAPAPRAAGPRYPWWAYPLAAAASVVLAFLVWWGNAETPGVSPRERIVRTETAEEPAYAIDPSMTANYRAELLARSFGMVEMVPDSFPPAGAPEWDEPGSLYAAVDASDANVLMLPHPGEDGAGDDNEATGDDEPTTAI